jgi:protein-tyrosine phosphatase
MKHYSILFVCNDNLCRSPTAEGVMRQKLIDQDLQDRVKVESAGTHDFNVEEPADIRAQKHATRRGYDLSGFRARLLLAQDFERFDLILAMDDSNMQTLQMRCPPDCRDKLHYFTEFLDAQESLDIADPFYGNEQDFEQVLDQIEDGCIGLLKKVQQTVG